MLYLDQRIPSQFLRVFKIYFFCGNAIIYIFVAANPFSLPSCPGSMVWFIGGRRRAHVSGPRPELKIVALAPLELLSLNHGRNVMDVTRGIPTRRRRQRDRRRGRFRLLGLACPRPDSAGWEYIVVVINLFLLGGKKLVF